MLPNLSFHAWNSRSSRDMLAQLATASSIETATKIFILCHTHTRTHRFTNVDFRTSPVSVTGRKPNFIFSRVNLKLVPYFLKPPPTSISTCKCLGVNSLSVCLSLCLCLSVSLYSVCRSLPVGVGRKARCSLKPAEQLPYIHLSVMGQ